MEEWTIFIVGLLIGGLIGFLATIWLLLGEKGGIAMADKKEGVKQPDMVGLVKLMDAKTFSYLFDVTEEQSQKFLDYLKLNT